MCLLVSHKKFLKSFPILIYVKQVTSRVGPFFTQGYNVNNLGNGLLNKTKYLVIETEIFKAFPHTSQCKTSDRD